MTCRQCLVDSAPVNHLLESRVIQQQREMWPEQDNLQSHLVPFHQIQLLADIRRHDVHVPFVQILQLQERLVQLRSDNVPGLPRLLHQRLH